MSKYTTELRYICESKAGLTESADANEIDDIINEVQEELFGESWPIFDEEYRSVLEHKIIKHFYLQEIGYETAGLWQFALIRKMEEIMPFYNRLYKAELDVINPFDNTNYYRHGKSTNKGESDNSRVNSNKGTNTMIDRNAFSNTPQSKIDGVEDSAYLTDYRKITNDLNTANLSRDNSNNKFTNVDQYLDHLYGKVGGESYYELLYKMKNKFVDIDMMIIGELQTLFMNLW